MAATDELKRTAGIPAGGFVDGVLPGLAGDYCPVLVTVRSHEDDDAIDEDETRIHVDWTNTDAEAYIDLAPAELDALIQRLEAARA